MVIKHISRFQLLMAVQRGVTVVPCGRDLLVYGRGVQNDFDTPLACRGPRAEVEALLEESRS